MIKPILKRFGEPSSWAALTALAALIHPMAGEIVPYVGQVGVVLAGAVTGIVGILKKEKGSPE